MTNEDKKGNANWTFLTNHAHVLLCISEKPNLRMRDLADLVGITERSVQRIVADLIDEGYVEIERDGRCNAYRTNGEMHLRHPIEAHKRVGDLLRLIKGPKTEIDEEMLVSLVNNK
jgi:Mn-dependent DtxR family transcriptional regulator